MRPVKKTVLYLLLPVSLSLACSLGSLLPSGGDSNRIATQVAAGVAATETASAPRATPTQVAASTQAAATSTPPAQPASTASAPIGRLGSPSGGQFGPIHFAAGVLDDNSPVDVIDSFPQGVTIVYATYEGQGLSAGDSYRTEWLFNGQVQTNLGNKYQWSDSSSPKQWEDLFNKDGIPAGEWQMNLYLGGTLQQSAKFEVTPVAAGQPGFGPIVFAPGIDSNSNAVNPLPANDPTLPAGAKNVYAFFSGIDVSKGTQWTYQWFHNGNVFKTSQIWSWDFQPNDGIHFSLLDQDGAIDPGTYELKLLVGSRLAGIGTVYVPQSQAAAPGTPVTQPTAAAAGTPVSQPTAASGGHFSPIRFAPAVLDDGSPVDVMDSFPQGLTLVYATFEGQGLNSGDSYRTEWLFNGQVQTNLGNKYQWDASASPNVWINLFNKDGLSTGEWQMNLYLGDTLQQSAKFEVTPVASGQPGFGPIVFAPGIDSNNQAVNPVPANDPTLSAGAKNVYAFFSGINVPKSTQWAYQWLLNGKVLTTSQTWSWDFGPNDGVHFSLLDQDGAINPGTYELKLFFGSSLAAIGTVYAPQSK